MGKFQIHSISQFGEGQKDDKELEQQIAFAALPDSSTVLCMQYAKAPHRIYLRSVKGLMLSVPNDIFNDFKRKFKTTTEPIEFKGLEAPNELMTLNSKIVNIDNKINVELLYGSDSLVVNRPYQRQITITHKDAAGGHLYTEELCSKCLSGTRKHEAGELVLDECFAVQTGLPYSAPRFVDIEVKNLPEECRVAAYRGADGKVYTFAANFGDKDALIEFGKNPLSINAMDCRLITLPEK